MVYEPYTPVEAVALATAVNVFAVLSISVSVSVPVAVAVPAVALFKPPASITLPVVAPPITATSFDPLMVTLTACCVPSTVDTVNVSTNV